MLKTKKTIVTKVISFILSMLILFYAVPSVVYAETIDALSNLGSDESSTSVKNSSYGADFKLPMYEVEELREENVKHFKLSDGSYVAAQYNYPVHYEDETGRLLDIDNALSNASGGVYANKNARVKFAKKITGNESLFTLHDGNTKITFSLIGAEKGTKGVVTNREDSKEDTELQKMMNLENLTSSVIYNDILDGTDLEYVVESLNIKENIIVKEKKDEYVYTFEIKLNGLTAVLTDSGDIEIADVSLGEVKYVIPAPVIYDAEGAYAEQGIGSYTLSDGGNGKYTLVVSVSGEWMNSAERVFPVTVDPTVKVSNSNVVDLTISSSTPDTVTESSMHLILTTGSIAYWKTTSLPTLPAGAYVTSGHITMRTTSASASPKYVCAHEVLTAWNENTLTWNSHNAATNPVGKLADVATDYDVIDSSVCNWNITPIVRNWYASSNANKGVAFKNAPETSGTNTFYSSEADEYYRPSLTITYSNMSGVEDYWSYSSHSIGVAGSGSINLASGYLTLAISTLSTTDSLMPFTPTLVYNSAMANKDYLNSNTETANTVSYMPLGFKLNICETVIEKTYVDAAGEETRYYVYADADGTEYAFYQADEEGSVYYDDSGLQKILEYNDADDTITIIDDSKITKKFVLSPASGADKWYLTEITDRNGNSIIFTFDSSLRPTKVSLMPKNISRIDFLELSYYSTGKLRMVYNPTSKDAVVFRYSGSYSGSISATSTKYLKRIDYAHGSDSVNLDNWNSFANSASNTANITVDATATYTYNSAGRILSATDLLASQKLSYVWSGNKVTQIKQSSTGGTLGQAISYTYQNGYTDVKTSGNDEVINTDDDSINDDIITRYVFDSFGRCKSVYSTAADGTEIYGATVGEYETQENVKNNLKEQTVLGGSSVNYLLNGGFEEYSQSTGFAHWTMYDGAKWTYAGYGFDGENAVNLCLDSQNLSASISQRVSLAPGKYTLSMPYKTTNSDNCTASVSITSCTGSGFSHTERISLSQNYRNGTAPVFSTTFEISGYAGGNDIVEIEIIMSTETSRSTAANLDIDCVMLENNVGASSYSFVQYGSFEASGIDSSGSATSVSSYWTTESGTAPTLVTDSSFGKAAYISGKINQSKYIKQCIFSAGEPQYSMSTNFPSGRDFVVSGFAKATDAMPSENASFNIEIKITYNDGYSVRTESVKFPFLPSLNGWQFAGGSFTAESDYVTAIEVYCNFSNQVGSVCFDNISVTTAYDSDIVRYSYYENGLVAKKESLFHTEYYEYDEHRNLTRTANNKGELTDYFYTENNEVDYILEYTFTYNSWTDYPFHLDDPDSAISKTAKYKTDYTYNAQGLTTSIVTYPIDNSLELASGGMKSYVNYRYDTTAQSKTFGALTRESNSLDVDIYYFYDSNDGKLLASINYNEGNGVCYTYDEMGNLTGVMPAAYRSLTTYTQVTDAESVSYTYNARNLLDTITTESTTYSFTYDVFGNTTSVSAGTNELAEYTYNQNNGKLNKITYGNGFSVSYVYNALELLTEVWYNYADGTSEKVYEYEYTADGQVYKFIDNVDDRSVIYKYDSNGRLTAFSEYANGQFYHNFTSLCNYDENGRLSITDYELNFTNDGALDSYHWYYSYSYENDGRLSQTRVINEKTDGYETYTYDDHKRVSKKVNSFSVTDNTSTHFTNQIDYTFSSLYGWTSSQIATYTSKINDGDALTYTYTYDQNGNITKIVYSTGAEIRYVYDDIGQLIREDNGLLNKTYVYTYDNAGNITSKKTYALTAAGTTPSGTTSTYNYGYTSSWGDKLTSYRGVSITYDAIGNPLSYYNGTFYYDFTWTGRQLTGASENTRVLSFTYNDEGIRTAKTVDGVTTTYYLDGTRIVGEETNGNVTIYLYDSEGLPIGMQYHGESYDADVWNTYWFERNLQGDVVAVYNQAGTKLIEYRYDAWGKYTSTYYNGGSSTTATKNPFRYRGYYYDQDLGLYYLNTRYYDANTGRFISPDTESVITATPDALTDKNLYAYCDNNPVMRRDDDGEFWNVIAGAFVGAAVSLVSSAFFEFTDKDFKTKDWAKVLAKISVSTLIGAAEGAAMALAPGASVAISAFASAADTAIAGLIDGKDLKTIAVDSFVSGTIGACAGSGGSDFVKGGKLMNEAGGYLSKMRKGVHPVVKKAAKKTVKKAVKYIGKSTGFGLMEDLAYGGINKFGSWYAKNAIDAWAG